MARIPYFDTSQATGRAAEAYKRLPALNIFRMLGHSGEMVSGFTKLGTQILNYASLDPVLREIAIIRVGVLSKATYEVHQHERIARRMGMSEPLIAAIRDGPAAAGLDEAQREVMAFTDDVSGQRARLRRDVRAAEESASATRHSRNSPSPSGTTCSSRASWKPSTSISKKASRPR